MQYPLRWKMTQMLTENRSSYRKYSVEKGVLKIPQILQENTYLSLFLVKKNL